MEGQGKGCGKVEEKAVGRALEGQRKAVEIKDKSSPTTALNAVKTRRKAVGIEDKSSITKALHAVKIQRQTVEVEEVLRTFRLTTQQLAELLLAGPPPPPPGLLTGETPVRLEGGSARKGSGT